MRSSHDSERAQVGRVRALRGLGEPAVLEEAVDRGAGVHRLDVRRAAQVASR